MREQILGMVMDMVSGFLYYDRKEDMDCPVGAIELAVKNGEVTVEEIIEEFSNELRKNIE